MIIRTVQVVTKPGAEAAFSQYFHNEAITLSRKVDGIVSVLPGGARRETPREYSFTMVWRDMTALQSFVGEDINRPHFKAREADLVESRVIKHYDLVVG